MDFSAFVYAEHYWELICKNASGEMLYFSDNSFRCFNFPDLTMTDSASAFYNNS